MKVLLLACISISSIFAYASDISADRAKSLFERLDEECAGNDNGFVTQFKVSQFNAGKAKKELRKDNNGCRGMAMSKSQSQAVRAFEAYLNHSDDDFTTCSKKTLTEEELQEVVDVARDPSNLGVFSSQFAGGDESEACYFHHFVIYRKNGQKIKIVHDETD